MPATVTSSTVVQHDARQFSAKATTLQLPSGQWPIRLLTELGNFLPFTLAVRCSDGAIYRQLGTNIILTVSDA